MLLPHLVCLYFLLRALSQYGGKHALAFIKSPRGGAFGLSSPSIQEHMNCSNDNDNLFRAISNNSESVIEIAHNRLMVELIQYSYVVYHIENEDVYLHAQLHNLLLDMTV